MSKSVRERALEVAMCGAMPDSLDGLAARKAVSARELAGPLRWEMTERAWHSGMVITADDTVPSLASVVEAFNALRHECDLLAAECRAGRGDDAAAYEKARAAVDAAGVLGRETT